MIDHREIVTDVVQRVATITIDRPERRNALTLDAMAALGDAIERCADDPQVWIIVLRGAGEQAFCAGADLKEAAELGAAGRSYPHPMRGGRRNLFELLLEAGKPTIAALNGTALGAGCELALACDIRIMAADAVIGLPEAKRGMGANFASVVLPRLVPRAIAFDMLYTGRTVSSDEALTIGLINQVHARERFDAAVDDYAQLLAANAPLTLQRYKQMASRGWDLPIAAALRLDAGPNPYASNDRVEGAKAFLEKRAPEWSAT